MHCFSPGQTRTSSTIPRTADPAACRVVVVAISNEFRRDDGVGEAVVAAAQASLPRRVRTVVLDGEPTRLIDAWRGTDLAVVVDAVSSGAAPGGVFASDFDESIVIASTGTAGTHSQGLGEAVDLARRLDRMPGRLVVVGVEGADFETGRGLSPAVSRAVPEAAGAVVGTVRSFLAPAAAE